MSNSIAYPQENIKALDLAYQVGSLTSFLDNTQSKWEGKEFKIKRISVQGPASISRGGAYQGGDVTAAWQTVTPDYDRGRKFTVDALDEIEALGLVTDAMFEYEGTWSIPEIDAYRFAKYASKAGLSVATEATLSTADAFLAALIVGMAAMDGNAPANGRVLFAEMSLLRAVQGLDTTKSREVLASFSKIVGVPSNRFYTKITLQDGSTSGQEDGGFIRYGSQYPAWAASTAYTTADYIEMAGKVYHCTTAGTSGATAPTWPSSGTVADGTGALVWTFVAVSGHALNFEIVHGECLEQAIRRNVTPMDAPDADYDSWRISNRKYGFCDVKTNKTKFIYTHSKAA